MEAQASFELVARQLAANERSWLPQALELGPITKPLRRLQLGQLLEVLSASKDIPASWHAFQSLGDRSRHRGCSLEQSQCKFG